ncbi:hypothetical protein ADIARSV_1266 [Arcticibacter svalbardensis MN12-7]|uniref:DUF3098 domain-containing protein n=1 Tax=Arcticibacter svalbardensis MN12-7 TaxID=1150600 RepID=R9GV79_9SPHI|nr:DUF3098 domain-containing protein [Arcticibacter svalbardensis]EOR95583.1 hypothetical protein ADIARSV_1266 [Arcticibacter svalbardensis MN12-7]
MAKKTILETSENKQAQFIFDKSNYRLLILSIVVVAFGFLLMSGTTDIYDFRKIVVAPIVVIIGFVIGFFAILKKRK